MRILTIMMARNAEERLAKSLTAISGYSDSILILNDRSVDRTKEVALSFKKVSNVFSVDPDISVADWFFSESKMINILYRMADFYGADWIIHLDDDEVLEPHNDIRKILMNTGKDVSGIKCPKISTWSDSQYPLMVPLMGKATQRSGAIWRYYPGLIADSKPLHNSRMPKNIEVYGKVVSSDDIKFFHCGWDTLEKRIQKVKKYSKLDPMCEYNNGVSYDKGLLFGYELGDLDSLISTYRTRYIKYLNGTQEPFDLPHGKISQH